MSRGELKPIRDRKKEYPELQYASLAPFIRIRMGWKPVPTPVLEQTAENEPSMKVACTFEDVEALLKELKDAGVEKAEICLVGFNIRGHDGRWPQIFPVEPALGGESQLRHLINRAKELGYAIVCHTNSTDAYSIADIWNEHDVIQLKNGAVSKNATSWSGGAMYDLCPEIALQQARQLLPKVAALGFRGLHYIDVISTVRPKTCYSPDHPVTARKCAEDWRQIMRLSRDLFGGFSSEGGYDFAASELDFGLYVSFGDKECPLSDIKIPLWQLVYHGYVMGNPYTETVNPDEKDWLKIVEYGGRPVIYFYSQFVTPELDRGNWMGMKDYSCRTQEERRTAALEIASLYQRYSQLALLQEEFMERHSKIDEGIFKIEYSDGSVITVDYNTDTYKYDRPDPIQLVQ